MAPIPDHLPGGVLPPFLDERDMGHTKRSPYRATVDEFVDRFATSIVRREILAGFLRHRAEVRKLGMVRGFQWVDGGFLDRRDDEPKDLDVVTLFRRPSDWTPEREAELLSGHPSVFKNEDAKRAFRVDAFFINLDREPREDVARLIAYWFGLFSHQRVTQAWRGLIQIPILTVDDDDSATKILETRGAT